MGSFLKLIVATITIVISATASCADKSDFAGTTYGSFIHFEKIPNALFFFDKIEKRDTFHFRKALRNHEINTVVLASPGGLIDEGLQMAGIIYDRKLTAYVPKFSECASACAFMFFGGDTKVAAGKLGVHQFSKDKDGQKKKEPVGVTDFVSQYTVSEIIGFLNEFGTPPFVYEKMFATKKMHYFSPDELKKISVSKSGDGQSHSWVWDAELKRSIPDLSKNKNLSDIESFLIKLSAFIDEEKCIEDTADCSSKQLCAKAVKDSAWVTKKDKNKFVKEAKRRGLSCNVIEKTSTCISDPSKCSAAELCSEVTMLKNGVTVWRDDPEIKPYLLEAKQRGLNCKTAERAPIGGTLAIYTEKQSYSVGDSIRLFIEPQRTCRLTLINIDDDNDSCVMFPHPDLEDKPITAGSTYIFPPKGSLKFSEPGVETVIAVCNFSPKAIEAELRDTSAVSCDKRERGNPGQEIKAEAILETFTFDISGRHETLSAVPQSGDEGSEDGSIVKAQISIPVASK